ncbi:sulfotransferase [Falsihalocynthiibacter sp. BN13B15]|uniref:sulfotransferase family protein n=1 Tax=Falsihalocynthiibacter sp. BN13B15 TaxID=3240871 RepID=UPI00351027BF
MGMQDKLVFIGGPPRSGTTLLQRMLNLHPLIYAGPEFDFVPPIIRLRKRMLASIESGRISEFLSEDELDEYFKNFLGGMLEGKLLASGKEVICEKSPANAEVMPDILDLFKDSKGIVILRDPKDVMASLFSVRDRYEAKGKQAPQFTVDAKSAIIRYSSVLNPTLEALERFPQRVCLVFYEDLVERPKQAISEVLDFLGLREIDEVLDLGRDDLLQKRDRSGMWHTQEQLTRSISQASVGKWKHAITNKDLVELEAAFGEVKLLSRYFSELDIRQGSDDN